MRLGLLIKDAEYRDALAEKLASFDNDLFVNILNGSNKDTSYSLILTDIMPDEIDERVLSAIKPRTVFLLGSDKDISDGCHGGFKYSSVSSLVSELSAVYNEWHGSGPGRSHASKLISVCSEADSYSGIKCLQLARQIIYGMGGRVIIIPLSYINDYGLKEYAENNNLSRQLYSIRTGRYREPDSFTYTDSYGVSYPALAPGINPAAYLDEEELRLILSGYEERFDAVICDAGTCFRKENISILKESDAVICFEHGRRVLGLGAMLGEAEDKLIRIKLSGGPDEAAAIDEAIRRVYGTEER